MACYGSMDNKEEKILLDETESYAMDASYDPEHPFGEDPDSFDEKFWQEVSDEKKEKGVDRVTALRLVRVRRLQQNCGDSDVLVDLITNKYDNYYAWCRKNRSFDMFQTFVFELSQLAEVILKEDFKSTHPKYLLEKHILADSSRRNILHLVAERNLTDIMDLLLNEQNGLAAITTYPDSYYPLHYALKKFHDDAAAKLIKHMSNDSVRDLFGDHDRDTEDLPTFSLADYITHGNMKKTVVAILDCLMNPDWPFMPVPKEEESSGISLPNLPFRYHFYYRLLDGDDTGLPGRKDNGDIVPEFNFDRKKSCLQLLSENSTQEDAMIRHPVVRMLMRSKWARFGKKWIITNCLMYFLFIIAMSIAFLSISSTRDRRSYSTGLDYFRLVCEIVTLLFTLVFIFTEASEVFRDKLLYLTDPFNFLDTGGLVLILVVIPLRITGCTTAEFIVSAAAYLINFLRVTKCAMAFKTISVYLKTIYLILTQDISRFVVMWGVFLMAFTGAVSLALKANENNVLLQEYNNGTYWHVLLQEVRSLAESSGFAETETYHAINVAISVLLTVNMFFCLIVLNNILIGQIGNSYNAAVFDAKVQYDIDRTKMVTRIESQVFCMPWYLRRSHYIDKEFLNNSVLEEDLLEDWAMIKRKSEEKEKKKKEIKSPWGKKNKVSSVG